MKKYLSLVLFIALCLMLLTGCDVWGKDVQSQSPNYHVNENGENYTFTLELREPSDQTEIASGDIYSHSTVSGELIYQWQIPMYGNTVYESVKKFFENRNDKITFRLSQHTYYMFHNCTLENGESYNLETVYVAADGVYSYCANYQSILGEDEIAGTEDDLKILTLVYEGWLY